MLALPCVRQPHTGARPSAARHSFNAPACARQKHVWAGAGARRPNSGAWTRATRQESRHDGRRTAAYFPMHWHVLRGTGRGSGK
ncbi:hypothetical protein HAX54_034426, partial [Datura stramonium]|nr:hypothetical protein [Datura stramonium]